MRHMWKGQQSGGSPSDPPEWVCYCELCGAEQTDDNVDDECVTDEEIDATLARLEYEHS